MLAESKQEIKRKKARKKRQNFWSGRTSTWQKRKVQKYQERNLKKKNTKTQKTHGRKSQEDFKQKNTKTQHVVMCFCVFFLFNIRLQQIYRTTLVNLTKKKHIKHKPVEKNCNEEKNTKRHKTQKTHLVILCLITSHIYKQITSIPYQFVEP